jgi:hypothetical protein
VIRRGFDSIVEECLDCIATGATVDDCLSQYPKHADKLRPILSLADKVRQTPLATARPGAQERAWSRVSARAAELRAGPRLISLPNVGFNYRRWVKPVAISTAVILALSSFGGGTVYASQDALPNSPLYRVKLASEDVRLWFVFDDTREAEILLDQSNERMDEILTLRSRGETVPENALSALHNRNERAAEIAFDHAEETALRARILTQAQDQEELLVALWPHVPDDARGEYAEALAHVHNTRLDGGTGNAFVSVRPEELTGGILDISGQAESLGDDLWSVGGVVVRIDSRTHGHAELQPGTSARFVVARASNDRLHALSVSSFQTGPAPTGAVVRGAVEEVRDDGITVAGQFIPFSEDTFPIPEIKVGEAVRITLSSNPTGVYAETVEPAPRPVLNTVMSLTFEGTIEGDVGNSTSRWTIGGKEFAITASTVFDLRAGAAADGARVQVEADNRNGALEAKRVAVISSQDDANTAAIIGTFEGSDETGIFWIVSGLPIVPPDAADPPVESLVVLDTRREGQDLVATTVNVIESPDDAALVRFQGTISAIDNSLWTTEFGQVEVRSTARVVGAPDVGVRVIVWAEQAPDGGLRARYVRVVDDTPVQVLVPAPTVAPSPSPVGRR